MKLRLNLGFSSASEVQTTTLKPQSSDVYSHSHFSISGKCLFAFSSISPSSFSQMNSFFRQPQYHSHLICNRINSSLWAVHPQIWSHMKKNYLIKFRISWICLLSSWSKENALENLSVILEATQWKLPEFVILKEQLQEQELPYAL